MDTELAMNEVPPVDVPPVDATTLIDQGWFVQYLASFINSEDLLRFAAVCRGTRVFRLTPAFTLGEESQSWNNMPSRYSPHDWQLIPRLEGLKLHTTHVRCQWRDQGWGNRKGMLCVVRGEGCAPNDSCKWGPDVMCGKEPAPHEWEMLFLSYSANGEHDEFRLCARAGGGGGHELRVKDLVVRAIALVDSPEAEAAFAAHFPA